ncbi:MAG: peptidylprolyl isomerase [Acidobacteriota bacterium]
MLSFNERLRLLLAALVALGLGSGLQAPEERILDEIVAKVNQDTITLTDLRKELRMLRSSLQDDSQDSEQLEQEFQKRKRSLLKNIIQNKMMIQKAEELGITANIDNEVASTMEQLRKQFGIPNMEVFDQALRQRGMTLQEYRQNIKEKMIVDWLMQQSVYSKIALLTPEIEEYYKQHQDQFTNPPKVKLAEILLLTEGKAKAKVRARAEQILSQLQSGTPFEDLAKEHSEGPTSARGGEIGEFKQGSLEKAIEDQVFRLEKDQVTGVIETNYGFQILKILDRQPAVVKPLEEVRASIKQVLYRQKAQPELKAFLDDLRRQSYIYIAPKYRKEYDVEGF